LRARATPVIQNRRERQRAYSGCLQAHDPTIRRNKARDVQPAALLSWQNEGPFASASIPPVSPTDDQPEHSSRNLFLNTAPCASRMHYDAMNQIIQLINKSET